MRTKERRLVRVAVSFDLLRDMMDEAYETHGTIRNASGLPSDAVFITDGFDQSRQIAYLIFYHESFDIVPHGVIVPEIPISHTIDYTATKLLYAWYDGMQRLRERDDAVMDAIVGQELDEVFNETHKYLGNLSGATQ